ncbi:MAG TPA: hypothetical protein VL178_15340 [Pseudomonas sp.]|nr:hypothetical protein [Pseudomonas sp.]
MPARLHLSQAKYSPSTSSTSQLTGTMRRLNQLIAWAVVHWLVMTIQVA